MRRLPELPAFCTVPYVRTDSDYVSVAFHLARHAPFEDDAKQAMHVACDYLLNGLQWIDLPRD